MKTLYVFEEGNLNILFWVPLLFEKKYSTTTPEVIIAHLGILTNQKPLFLRKFTYERRESILEKDNETRGWAVILLF